MKGSKGRRARRERAIVLLEKQIAAHEADSKLVTRMLEDKELSKTPEEIEKIRKKKIERAKDVLANTKANL